MCNNLFNNKIVSRQELFSSYMKIYAVLKAIDFSKYRRDDGWLAGYWDKAEKIIQILPVPNKISISDCLFIMDEISRSSLEGFFKEYYEDMFIGEIARQVLQKARTNYKIRKTKFRDEVYRICERKI